MQLQPPILFMKIIAHIESDFGTKFGAPRQAGLIPELEARIVMEPEYRVADAFRGIEGFSHLWIIWLFDDTESEDFRPTVRPPRLGGNTRKGVFATRSPFRPNPIGLSSVEIVNVELDTPDGPVILVRGADMKNGTRIIDIKPYLPFTDCHPDANGGFTNETINQKPLDVMIDENLRQAFVTHFIDNHTGERKLHALIEVLKHDPRPHYQTDENRVYGMMFADIDIHFKVKENVLVVTNINF